MDIFNAYKIMGVFGPPYCPYL